MSMTSQTVPRHTPVLRDIEALVEQELGFAGHHENESVRSRRPTRTRAKVFCVLLDSTALIVGFAVAFAVARLTGRDVHRGTVAVVVGMVPVELLLLAHGGLYQSRFLAHHIEESRRLLRARSFAVVLFLAIHAASNTPVSARFILLCAILSTIALFVDREIQRLWFRHSRIAGRRLRPVLMVGGGKEAADYARVIGSEAWSGVRIVGYVADHESRELRSLGVDYLGHVAEAGHVANERDVSGAIFDSSALDSSVSSNLARDFAEHGYYVEFMIGARGLAPERLEVVPLGRISTVLVQPVARVGWRVATKRMGDLVVAGGALVALSPLFAVVALAIKLEDRGPVFFRQDRVGKLGRTFRAWKFRSMQTNAEALRSTLEAQNEAGGGLFKIKTDPRITRVGRLIRRTSIDELPQLLNVISGEMSIVGPRPLPVADVRDNWEERMAQRLRVRPGITGMWQVSGRSDLGDDDFLKLDLYYVDNWSPFVDLLIIAKTIPAVLFAKGAY